MKKIDETVKKETVYIAAWTVILSVLTQAVFLVAGLWRPDVLFGNLIGAFTAVLNFFLLGITVQKAIGKDEKDAAQTMRFSQSSRMFMQLALGALGAYFFNPVTAIIPLFFPRIAIIFRPLFNKKATDAAEGETSEGGESTK